MENSRFYYKVCTGLGIALICFILQQLYLNNTSGITISSDRKNLQCDKSISINAIRSVTQYYNDPAIEASDLKSRICSFDAAFDQSLTDRSHLFHFGQSHLEWMFINRHDIAQYFYHRIIDADPDDALSTYIKNHKLDQPL